ncbi:MAG: hypothetical protein HN348_30230, partial [Proteobacteria bacterium]|nr:hypothetical protein [Pseudomonadota bacterium]
MQIRGPICFLLFPTTLALYGCPGGSTNEDNADTDTDDTDVVDVVPPDDPIGEWTWLGGPTGGLGYDIRVHPQNHDIMYVTDALAGAFKSEDGGQNWFPINKGITARSGESDDSIPVFCLTIDPNDPNTLWAGTLDQRGVFKSTDAGQNWTQKVSGIVEETGVTFRGFTVDPKSSDIVYAAGEIASWSWSSDEKRTHAGDMTRGFVYRTTDGGDNWTAIWRGDNLARYVIVHPDDSDIIYISTGIFDRDAANSAEDGQSPGGEGILKSTNGGQIWNQVNNGLDSLFVGSLFMHPDEPETLLAGVGNAAYPDGAGVYLTTNGGTSWEWVLEGESIVSVEFSSSNPDIAYAGSFNSMFRSDDGAKTWTKLNDGDSWGPPNKHAGHPIDFQV